MHLTSVEHDRKWFERTQDQLRLNNLLNVDHVLIRLPANGEEAERSEYVRFIDRFPDKSLDFILVDAEYRDLCANVSLSKIRPGGILIIDNINWYIPCGSKAPSSRSETVGFVSNEWESFFRRVESWRRIWTSNGVWDTAIWFKPVAIDA
jgi:predicted O-methyltransferase YrrM